MILLTGGTGFLGRELLVRLLTRDATTRVALLIRGENFVDSSARLANMLAELFDTNDIEAYRNRIEVICGDVTEDGFGLSESEFHNLAARLEAIFHCAASTALNQELSQARKINVGGTFQVLKLAEKAVRHSGAQFRLHHVSTAFVAGAQQGIVHAHDLNIEGPFRNAYERSKAEAESLVRGMQDSIPVSIYRPSIIVGDSTTGRTSAFNVIYIPAKLLAKGLFSRFPACPHTPFDIVPVNYVADAIAHLSSLTPETGSCYHVTAGVGRESNPFEISQYLFMTLNKYRRKGRALLSLPPLVPPEVLNLLQSSLSVARSSMKTLERHFCDRINVFRQALPFIPYMTSNPQFDNTETLRDLGAGFPLPPMFDSYAERLFKYCLDTNWGKTKLPALTASSAK